MTVKEIRKSQQERHVWRMTLSRHFSLYSHDSISTETEWHSCYLVLSSLRVLTSVFRLPFGLFFHLRFCIYRFPLVYRRYSSQTLLFVKLTGVQSSHSIVYDALIALNLTPDSPVVVTLSFRFEKRLIRSFLPKFYFSQNIKKTSSSNERVKKRLYKVVLFIVSIAQQSWATNRTFDTEEYDVFWTRP
jgi:hypothetical protein